MTDEGKSDDKLSELSKEVDKRPQFGNRHLVDASKVFEHNAWDNVEWDEQLAKDAKTKVDNNSMTFVANEEKEKYESLANEYWDKFYSKHENKFFKDRHWLFTEFPELSLDSMSSCESEERKYVFEVGCGVGNTVFPLLQSNNHPNLFVYCCDISASAIKILKENPIYETSRCHAFVCNVASDDDPEFPFKPNSMDVITLIFVLSAIDPNKMSTVIKRLASSLKPGGILLFRDYGQYDMVQLRFKPGHCLSENFYVRGDGTRVYFFTQDELDKLFSDAGLIKKQNSIDRRLQVNRGRQLKMYRIWIQCKYMKPME